MGEQAAKDAERKYQVVTIGAGPAALAAAVYSTREDLSTLLIEKGVIGGLAAITDLVDNYPGFSKGVGGLELAEELRKQAERFGAEFELAQVDELIDEGKYKRLKTTSGDILAEAVLIATGSDYRKAGVPGEKKYYGRGVHYCATCDGAFYRDKKLAVIGSGNSSAQESIFLTRFASHIDILIRGDKWKASDVLVDKIAEFEKEGKLTVHFNTTTKEIVGENEHVTKVVVEDSKTNKTSEIELDAVFVFVGLDPNTKFLSGSKVELDEQGFVKTNDDLETSVPGVFCAGDVRSGATMQIASAVGEGATAALKIREYIEKD